MLMSKCSDRGYWWRKVCLTYISIRSVIKSKLIKVQKGNNRILIIIEDPNLIDADQLPVSLMMHLSCCGS